MSVARFYQPENRLAKAIATPGGKRISDALADAQTGVASLADECLATIDQTLVRVYAACSREPDAASLKALYEDLRDVAGVAAAAGLEELGASAQSLCSLIDGALNGRPLQQRHLRVCADVLRTLRQAQQFPPAERKAVTQSLDAMVQKLSTR